MDAAQWKFETMSFYSMGSLQEMHGTVSLRHGTSQTKIEMKLLPEDLVKIFSVIEDRVVDSFASSARAFFIEAGVPVKAFQPQVEDKGALDATDQEAAFGVGLPET